MQRISTTTTSLVSSTAFVLSKSSKINIVGHVLYVVFDFGCNIVLKQYRSMNQNVRSMMESYSQLREMFQNPKFLLQLTSPEIL
jgi:hypothetical protein